MKLRHLTVSGFRGIRDLDWKPHTDFVCLIGQGDTCKSAILDAVDFVASPRWNISVDDSDFYGGDTRNLIVIEATVTDLPSKLLKDKKWGKQIRGWGTDGTLHDEPNQPGDEAALTIRLTVGPDLEPQWTVVNDRLEEPARIRAQDRELLGVARLGAFIDSHLSWSRTSVLTRLTESSEGVAGVLASAVRAAKAVMTGNAATPQPLSDAASQAQALGASLAVPARTGFRPSLDTAAIGVSAGALALHDGEVPLRRAGTGTKRLLALAIQRQLSKSGGVLLVDEVEHGLEPHRIKRLLRLLRSGHDYKMHGPFAGNGHVLVTTHAPTVLQELSIGHLGLVRRTKDGLVTVAHLPDSLQALLRRAPDSFLGCKVVVCEGKTEIGISRALDDMWAESGEPFALMGVNLAFGNGSEAPGFALSFANLGYATALFCDSDRELSPSPSELANAGVEVIKWDEKVSTEQRVFSDLPVEGVNEALRLAIAQVSAQGVAAAIAEALGQPPGTFGADVKRWWEQAATEKQFRDAVGKAANEREWCKREDLGEALGKVIVRHYATLKDTDLRKKLERLREWTRR